MQQENRANNRRERRAGRFAGRGRGRGIPQLAVPPPAQAEVIRQVDNHEIAMPLAEQANNVNVNNNRENRPKKTWYRNFEHALAAEEVVIPTEMYNGKFMEAMCRRLNVKYRVDASKTMTSCTHHEDDGGVGRDVARMRVMKLMHSVVDSLHPGVPQNWCDAWGNSRNCRRVHRLNQSLSNVPDPVTGFTPNLHGRVNLQLHRSYTNSNDMPRMARPPWMPEDVMAPNGDYTCRLVCDDPIQFFTLQHYHAVLLEDVQYEDVMGRDSVLSIVSGGLVVGIIFHLMQGSSGMQGNQGFWIKEDGSYWCYPDEINPPYKNDCSGEWLFEDNSAVYNGVDISWVVVHVYSNVYIAVVSPIKIEVKDSYKPPVETRYEDISFSIQVESDSASWSAYIASSLRNLFLVRDLRQVEVNHSIAYEIGRQFTPSNIEGMSDRNLQAAVESAFQRLPNYRLMATRCRTRYMDLVTGTAIYARRLAVGHQDAYFTAARANCKQNARVYDDARNVRNVRADLMAACCCAPAGCCIMSQRCLTCISALSFPAMSFGGMGIFTWSQDLDQEYHDIVTHDRGDIPQYLSNYYGWRKFRIESCTLKRRIASAYFPDDIADDVSFKTKGKPPRDYDETCMFNDSGKSGSYTYAFGPSPVPFHYNRVSGAGMQRAVAGIVRRRPVEAPEQALGWETHVYAKLRPFCVPCDVLAEDIPLAMLGRAPVVFGRGLAIPLLIDPQNLADNVMDIGDAEMRAWAMDHKSKSKLYLAAIAKNSTKTLMEVIEDFKNQPEIMQKTNDAVIKPKDRSIVCVNECITVIFAVYMATLCRRLKFYWNNDTFNRPFDVGNDIKCVPVYGMGLTSENLGMWATRASHMENRTFTVIQGGDDMAAVVRYRNVSLCIELDDSAFDWHQQGGDPFSGSLGVAFAYCVALGVPRHVVLAMHRFNHSTLTAVNPDDSRQKVTVDLSKVGMRLSGEAGTSVLNTIVGMAKNTASLTALILAMDQADRVFDEAEIDDFITAFNAGLGHKAKVKTVASVDQLTFFKGFFVPIDVDEGHEYLWYPSPERLCKLGITCTDAVGAKHYVDAFPILKTDSPQKAAVQKQRRRAQFVYDSLYTNSHYRDLPLIGALLSMVGKSINRLSAEATVSMFTPRVYNNVEYGALIEEPDVPEVRVMNEQILQNLVNAGWYNPYTTVESGAIVDRSSGHSWDGMLTRLGVAAADWHAFIDCIAYNDDWEPGHFLYHPVWLALSEVYRS